MRRWRLGGCSHHTLRAEAIGGLVERRPPYLGLSQAALRGRQLKFLGKVPAQVIFTILSFAALLTLGFGLATSEAAVVTALFLAFLQVGGCLGLMLDGCHGALQHRTTAWLTQHSDVGGRQYRRAHGREILGRGEEACRGAQEGSEGACEARLGPEFMTYTWLGINMGQVLSVGFLGPVVAALGPRAPYCVAAPLEPWFLKAAVGSQGLSGAVACPGQLHGRTACPRALARAVSASRRQAACLSPLGRLAEASGAVQADVADWSSCPLLGGGSVALCMAFCHVNKVSTFFLDQRYLLSVTFGMAVMVLGSFAVFIRPQS